MNYGGFDVFTHIAQYQKSDVGYNCVTITGWKVQL